ncbi:hypothetical protein [Rhizobium sp. SGZ-381]|uniref:hypothetical protein n=1 Tax=Rhizobium sp. SGZ-381 TaxID=3342800 RepID=UPI00366B4B5B
MNWAAYEVGKRVVCVVPYDYARKYCTVVPVKGTIYTIKATSMGENWNGEIILGLRFSEIEAFTAPHCGVEARDGYWWWRAMDFKPVDETRLDQFRKHLTSTPWQRELVE